MTKPTEQDTAQPASRRARGLLALAVEIDKILRPHHRKRGIGSADLAGAWTQIMGRELAAQCGPRRLVRGPQGTAGTLHINVWGPLALELQHLSPQLIERINGHYGYRAVDRLAFHQTAAPAGQRDGRRHNKRRDTTRRDATPRNVKPRPASELRAAAEPPTRYRGRGDDDRETRAAAIEDAELRAALLALGRSVDDETAQ